MNHLPTLKENFVFCLKLARLINRERTIAKMTMCNSARRSRGELLAKFAFRIFVFLSIFLITEISFPIFAKEKNSKNKVFIVTYHKIGNEDTEYTRSRESFRNDLNLFFSKGFVPISVLEFASGKFEIPQDKKPILLTFDDSSISQMEYTPEGKLDPNCGLGILEEFIKSHPQFRRKAVFFITPGAKSPNDLFGQKKFTKSKLEFLYANGYEVENHTLWHANLKKYSAKIEEQVVKANLELQKYFPEKKMEFLALPFGIYPPEKEIPRLKKGNYKGIAYEHKLVFDYTNKLSLHPNDPDFDPMRVHRIHGNSKSISRALSEF